MAHILLSVSSKRVLSTKKKDQIPQVTTSTASRTFKFKASKSKKKDRKFTNNFYLAFTFFPIEYVCSILVDEHDKQHSKKVCRERLKLLLNKAKVHLMQPA